MTLSVVVVSGDALCKICFTDKEGHRLLKGRGVGNGSVGADTGIYQSSVVTLVHGSGTTTHLRASMRLGQAPVEQQGAINLRDVEALSSSRWHGLRYSGGGRNRRSARGHDGLSIGGDKCRCEQDGCEKHFEACRSSSGGRGLDSVRR